MNYPHMRTALRTIIIPFLQKLVLLLFWVEPSSLTGRQVRTTTLVTLSIIVAWIASVTNFLNSLGVFPILTATFRSWGIAGFFLAVLCAVLLNILQNHLTSLLVRRGEFRRLAKVATIGLIALQILLTSCSTVGGQLSNSRGTLGQEFSLTLITDAQQELKRSKERFMQSPLYVETKQNCEQGRARMDAPPPPGERDRVILETVGGWKEREKLGVSATPNSYCGKWNSLQEKTHQKYSRLDRPIEEAQSQGFPPLKIVEEVLPERYEALFDRHGYIADGNTELAVALSRTARLMRQGKFSELGTSLLLLSLSKVTSVILIIVLIAYSQHYAVIMSFSPRAGLVKQQYLK